jgi:two-component system response regulator DesR
MRIRVLLAEHVDVLRETLVALLELDGDLAVVARPVRADRVLPDALAHRPEVALVDVDLPDAGGLGVAAALTERLPGCRVLVLTGLAPLRTHPAGVSGVLHRDGPAERLIEAVRAPTR